MIDHIGIRVRNVARSRRFYEATLAPLGYRVLIDFGAAVGFGTPGGGAVGQPDFWITAGGGSGGVHIAFTVTDREQVDGFHAKALAAGGDDNGAPGPRAHYHPGYYGAFVLDPDGNNIEAVCHVDPGKRRRPAAAAERAAPKTSRPKR